MIDKWINDMIPDNLKKQILAWTKEYAAMPSADDEAQNIAAAAVDSYVDPDYVYQLVTPEEAQEHSEIVNQSMFVPTHYPEKFVGAKALEELSELMDYVDFHEDPDVALDMINEYLGRN